MGVNIDYLELEKLLTDLKDATQAILQVSFDDESMVELIESLQMRQEHLRGELDACLARLVSNKLPGSVRVLVDECIHLEQLVYKQLASYKDEAQLQIIKLTQGTKAKSLYQKVYAQPEGFFIDHRSKGQGQGY